MTREDVQSLGGPAAAAERMRSLVPGPASVEEDVEVIIANVWEGGDAAVNDLTREYDTGGAEPRPLLVEPEELDEAIKALSLDVVAGLQVAIANVAQVAQAAVSEAEVPVDLPQGQRIVLREVPVTAAAVYVPGGRAAYPSTAVMGVVAARAAGVLDVAVCSPPGRDGEIDLAILGTCRLLGVERVYRMGGAQAIAALAYGTQTVERVDVIVGPGNLYVQEAKRQLAERVGIDGFAGPSDLLVVFGEDADPRLVALDMAAQAEHGSGSLVAAVSPSSGALELLADELERLAEQYPQLVAAACVLVQSADAREALQIANAFAPEHLQLIGAEPEALVRLAHSAGCVFVGAAAATAFGDYVAGSNHILPTGGAARFSSGLSPRHFRRRVAEVRLGEVGGETARKLAAAGAPIARAEGFELHARSMEARAGETSPAAPRIGQNPGS
ncbi:MAG TPA: histidinol dehydrogenase [Solirubrobacteraceae bacterium]|nr:histidinol dehydrogenase [Solirubrobacteraceae bacterium]